MAVHRNDKLSKALNGIVVDSRFTAWIWLYLKNKHRLDLGEFESYGMRDQIANLIIQNPPLKHEIEQQKSSHLLPDKNLEWITSDERQHRWVIDTLNKTLGFEHAATPPNLTGRALVIALIDFWKPILGQKTHEVREIESNWKKHKKADHIFQWFNTPDEDQKCALAWEIMTNKFSYLTVYKPPFKSHQELLIFFDQHNLIEAEKKLIVDAIKKRWSQNKYRAKMTNKKQYNFIISDKAISRLDKLAEKYDLKRTQVLEILLQMETEKGIYIPEKLKAFADL